MALALALGAGGCAGDAEPFRIDAETGAPLRQVVAAGAARGNRADVFSKVGDGITFEPGAFVPVGCPPNSFTRASRAAIPPTTPTIRPPSPRTGTT